MEYKQKLQTSNVDQRMRRGRRKYLKTQKEEPRRATLLIISYIWSLTWTLKKVNLLIQATFAIKLHENPLVNATFDSYSPIFLCPTLPL